MGNCIMDLNEMESEQINDGNATLTKVRSHLTQESIGMNLIRLQPRSGTSGFPRHDHKDDGYEETYVVMSGSGEVQIDDSEWRVVGEGSFIHVDPASSRQFRTNNETGLDLLAISGTPGQVYSPPAWSELDFDPASFGGDDIQTIEDAMFGGPVSTDEEDLVKDESSTREGAQQS